MCQTFGGGGIPHKEKIKKKTKSQNSQLNAHTQQTSAHTTITTRIT